MKIVLTEEEVWFAITEYIWKKYPDLGTLKYLSTLSEVEVQVLDEEDLKAEDINQLSEKGPRLELPPGWKDAMEKIQETPPIVIPTTGKPPIVEQTIVQMYGLAPLQSDWEATWGRNSQEDNE